MNSVSNSFLKAMSSATKKSAFPKIFNLKKKNPRMMLTSNFFESLKNHKNPEQIVSKIFELEDHKLLKSLESFLPIEEFIFYLLENLEKTKTEIKFAQAAIESLLIALNSQNIKQETKYLVLQKFFDDYFFLNIIFESQKFGSSLSLFFKKEMETPLNKRQIELLIENIDFNGIQIKGLKNFIIFLKEILATDKLKTFDIASIFEFYSGPKISVFLLDEQGIKDIGDLYDLLVILKKYEISCDVDQIEGVLKDLLGKLNDSVFKEGSSIAYSTEINKQLIGKISKVFGN